MTATIKKHRVATNKPKAPTGDHPQAADPCDKERLFVFRSGAREGLRRSSNTRIQMQGHRLPPPPCFVPATSLCICSSCIFSDPSRSWRYSTASPSFSGGDSSTAPSNITTIISSLSSFKPFDTTCVRSPFPGSPLGPAQSPLLLLGTPPPLFGFQCRLLCEHFFFHAQRTLVFHR